jgi:hypothetical protein
LNIRWFKSKDGGKTFGAKGSPHGDHHDLWIAPDDSDRMIIGDDGGGQVSLRANAPKYDFQQIKNSID